MRRKPRFKIQRRLLTELPGLGKAGAIARREYPPGEQGLKRRKYSEYCLQLEEKQKLRYHYGLKEKQLQRFIAQAKRGKSTNWPDKLVQLLECRLDNVLFRLRFAPSIAAARQLISHRKVFVSGKVLDISSATVKVGDQVSLKKEAYENQVFMSAQNSPRLELPYFLEVSPGEHGLVGAVKEYPTPDVIPFPFNMGLFIEYYSMKGI